MRMNAQWLVALWYNRQRASVIFGTRQMRASAQWLVALWYTFYETCPGYRDTKVKGESKFMTDGKRKLSKKDWIFICLFLGVLAAFHMAILPGQRDDIWFSEILDKYGALEYLGIRYQNWTSRLLPELTLIFFTRHLLLWKLVNYFVCLLLAYETLKLTETGNLAVGFLSLLVFPLWYMFETGWGTTFMCYIWPLAVGLFVLSVVKDVSNGRGVPVWKEIFAGLCLLYAVSTEQIAVVFFCVFAFACLESFRRSDRHLRVLTCIYMVETLGMMVFALTCPGNSARTVAETANHMPEFVDLSLVDKVVLGVNSAFSFLAGGDMTPFFFCGVLFLVALYEGKKIGVVSALLGGLYHGLIFAGNFLHRNIPIPQELDNVTAYGFFAWNVLFVLVVLVTLFLVAEDLWQGLFLVVLYGTGFLSRAMMGFSPTCFISGHRTFTFFDTALLIIGLLLIRKTKVFGTSEDAKKNRIFRILLYIGISALALFETVYVCQFLKG